MTAPLRATTEKTVGFFGSNGAGLVGIMLAVLGLKAALTFLENSMKTGGNSRKRNGKISRGDRLGLDGDYAADRAESRRHRRA